MKKPSNWCARERSRLEALIRLGAPRGNEYAKAVQAKVVIPGTRPLTVCVGSNYESRVEGFRFRPQGCLAIFGDAAFGTGNMWPTWCDDCHTKNGRRNPRRDQARALKRQVKAWRRSRQNL